jgi:hypothetical protein
MWYTGLPAADQCEGCTFNTGHVLELSYLHSRDVTFAVFCQGPYDESARYRDFMAWEMPWYSVPEESSDRLLAGRHFGMKVCYLRDGDRLFETYWTTGRACESARGGGFVQRNLPADDAELVPKHATLPVQPACRGRR